MKLPFRAGRQAAVGDCREAIEQQRSLIQLSCQTGMWKTLRQFNDCLRQADTEEAAAAAARIQTLCGLAEEMNALLESHCSPWGSPATSENNQRQGPRYLGSIPVYCASSMTLHECHRHLMRGKPGTKEEPEWMVAVTGLRIGQFFTLEHWLEFPLSRQSGGAAVADMQAFTQLMVQLEESGQALHALFHSHRFDGPPRPSAVDLNLQETLEQAGYPAIQGVFSEDGYVRFFAGTRSFEVVVRGQSVQEHGRFLYRLH